MWAPHSELCAANQVVSLRSEIYGSYSPFHTFRDACKYETINQPDCETANRCWRRKNEETRFEIIMVTTGWSRSHAAHSWHMFHLSKNKLHWNKKKTKFWKCPPRSAMHAFNLFPMFDATRWRVPVSWKRFTRPRYCRFVWNRRIGKCIPKTRPGKLSKNEMPGSVRQWTLVALVKKTSLHLDCWKTADGLARAGYNMTWPAWALV
jgi:hypothetical protein